MVGYGRILIGRTYLIAVRAIGSNPFRPIQPTYYTSTLLYLHPSSLKAAAAMLSTQFPRLVARAGLRSQQVCITCPNLTWIPAKTKRNVGGQREKVGLDRRCRTYYALCSTRTSMPLRAASMKRADGARWYLRQTREIYKLWENTNA